MGDVLPIRRDAPHGRRPEPLWREAVGEQLREERAARSERLADVAGRAGVSTQYLSELERGRKEPSSEVLGALAGALSLTQSAVSSAIRTLEDRLGVTLFQRIRQRMVMSDAGRAMLRDAEAILDDLDRSARKIMAFGGTPVMPESSEH